MTLGYTVVDPAVVAAVKQTHGNIAENGVRRRRFVPQLRRGMRIGRNELCPCGSGKKFKNCHLRRQ